MLACNGYLDALDPGMGGRMMPINNFILATEPLGEARARELIPSDVAVVDTRFVVNYFRLSADRRLLFGGGETTSSRLPADPGPLVRRCMLRIFPQLAEVRVDHVWGGTLAITRSRMPSIGRLEGGLYFAQGYSGHGVALATLGGALVAEAIAGTLERFDVFARLPQPPFPGGAITALAHARAGPRLRRAPRPAVRAGAARPTARPSAPRARGSSWRAC